MPDTELAKQVIGWMSHLELDWLAQQSAQREQVAEIGCFLGRSTRALADNAAGRVYAIDTWRDAEPHAMMRVPEALRSPDWCWQAFLRNVKDLIPAKLEVRRRKSVEAAQEFGREQKRFDLIFIDAAHDYESVKADILAWRPLLAEGGRLCGHDFTANHQDVVRAVRELVPQKQIVDTIWYEVA